MNPLSFLIKPASYRCNLDCTYCFYKKTENIYAEKNSIMSPQTAEVFIQKALDKNIQHNAFCWQGGEPTLLGLDFYKKVVAFQNSYSQSNQVIENSLQTNGLLLDQGWCSFLRDNQFLVGLSLDGPEKFHDHYRTYLNHKGSFQTVMRKVALLKKQHVEFNILTLLTDANIHSPDELYSFFRAYELNWLQFIPCFEHDPQSGESLPYTISATDLGKFYCRIFDLWLEDGFPYVSIRLFEDILIYMLDGVHASCSWKNRCDSYVVVEHNGDCYPCDFFVDSGWKLGNIVKDPLDAILENPLRQEFAKMKYDLPFECSTCRWNYFCNGDCTRYRFHSAGKYDRQSEFCTAWKMLLEHIEPKANALAKRAVNLRKALLQNDLETTSRNAPCPCGSAKKYKRCCGRAKR
jgi:uncharacterized protein